MNRITGVCIVLLALGSTNASIAYEGKQPRIVGSLIEFPPVVDGPGAPANAPADLKVGEESKGLELTYDGRRILVGNFSHPAEVRETVSGEGALEQCIEVRFSEVTTFKAVVHAGSEALAAEMRGRAQERLALVRTSHGLSNNLRNNAIYDRTRDWMLELPEGTRIASSAHADGTTRFELTFTARQAELVFRPRYYQKHKNIPHFQPWTYSIRKDSISGWCSWWAYRRACRQSHVDAVMQVWNEKHLGDYGYRFMQLDDAFQGGRDSGRQRPAQAMRNYIGGRPETWLQWKEDLFPKGMYGYVESVEAARFIPAIWIGCFFTDKAIAEAHPQWFVRDKDGKPFVGAWVTYVVDSTNPEAANALIRPTFRGLKNAGFRYVKIDQLRHMLYDNLNHNHEYLIAKGKRPDDIFRAYLRIAREELGDDCFILSCWGVLPESIGLADACRIGGDGYGPVTMQQYNSWNGIVWRNDPDHCDVSPRQAAVDTGNVLNTREIKAVGNDTIIRPALASIAGCMLMLSDKPTIYVDDRNLVGARRSAPVLFSVPGQLYDFDPRKTDVVKKIDRASVKGGTGVSKIDGDQFGEVCPFWLNEFNTPFENWYVLHRLNWTGKKKETARATTVRFADLGLDSAKAYLVYEFWENRLLGVLQNEIELGELGPMGLQSLAIRERLDRPQLVSTNRHLSQGAAEIEILRWEENTLSGRSKVIIGDRYGITVYVPANYEVTSATVNGAKAEVTQAGNLFKVSYLPKETASIGWSISFDRQ
jgi:alpha-galactosidase